MATVSRKRYQLEAMIRFNAICLALENHKEHSDLFLKDFKESCQQNPHRNPNMMDFLQHVSSCPRGIYCPSVTELLLEMLPAGYHTPNSYQRRLYVRPTMHSLDLGRCRCQPGGFCVLGNRINCIYGFICPDYGMTQPELCKPSPAANITCFAEGLVSNLHTHQYVNSILL